MVRSILISEKGWHIEDMKLQKRDAAVSVSIMFLLSFAVMACAAGTMFTKGLTVDNAIDMVKLMEPLAGQLAVSMFVAGIVCAGVSSLFPIIISILRICCSTVRFLNQQVTLPLWIILEPFPIVV